MSWRLENKFLSSRVPVTLAMPGLGTVLRAVSRTEAHHAEDLAAQPGK